MASAIRIANWVVIKILINYLLLFHREEISAYLIGITEMYSMPHLHKLNVKNKSTVCVWEKEWEGVKRECIIPGKICRWCKSDLLPDVSVCWGSDLSCLERCFASGSLLGIWIIERGYQTRGSQHPFFSSYQISLYQTNSQQYQILFSARRAVVPPATIPSETSYRMIFVCFFISVPALHML